MKQAKQIIRSIALLGLVAVAGCSNMNETQQRMLSGGAVGAAVGTVGTAMTGGCIPCGTAIGGAVGTGSGYLMDYLDKKTKE